MAPSNSKLKLKLLIDKKDHKVLFAEANKEFVDLLFSLMTLPLGTVVKLLARNGMEGCISDLYNSIASLDDTYIKSSQNLDSVLNPKPPLGTFQSPLLLSNGESPSRKAYMCLYQSQGYNRQTIYHRHVADFPNTPCPSCGNAMSCELQFVDSNCTIEGLASSSVCGGGFVKEATTYMIMDNLEVKPMSTISSITLINSFDIHDLSSLQEKVVNVGVDEGLKLLQLSLQSKKVLTSVFLAKRGNKRAVFK